MARATDVLVLGSGYRGLWLAAELVRLGWKVTWAPIQSPQPNKHPGGFVFDDWPLQVGPAHSKSKFIPLVSDFVEAAFRPALQEIAVQIVTPQGPLELSGPSGNLGLKKFFPKSGEALRDFFLSVPQGQKLLFAHTKKIFERPLSERWALEWLGSLRRPRAVSTKDWILNWSKEVLDPSEPFWILNDGLEEVSQRGIEWARGRGVEVRNQDKIVDVSLEGRVAKGVEIQGGEGFLETRFLVLACSQQTVTKKFPGFGGHLGRNTLEGAEKWAWIRCGFLLKKGTKPEGLLEFSSFVMDPFMPLVEGNAGFIKWTSTADNDHVTAWVRIPFGELKRRSYLLELTETLQKNFETLFARFAKSLMAVLPFEEYFHSPEVGHDDLAVVFDGKHDFASLKTRYRNVWIVGPGQDRGLEILSALATENRMLQVMSEIRNKELRKSDRKIHPAGNGPDMVRSK